jgi:hypothetical protein
VEILGPGIARETNGAQRAAKLAMHMNKLVRAGRFMQAIDVLRHGEDAAMLPLQPPSAGGLASPCSRRRRL